jgi:hypothetical protein
MYSPDFIATEDVRFTPEVAVFDTVTVIVVAVAVAKVPRVLLYRVKTTLFPDPGAILMFTENP